MSGVSVLGVARAPSDCDSSSAGIASVGDDVRFVGLVRSLNVPAALISAWLGHADVAFTMRTYVHSQPDALAQAAQSLARVVTIRDHSRGRDGSG